VALKLVSFSQLGASLSQNKNVAVAGAGGGVPPSAEVIWQPENCNAAKSTTPASRIEFFRE
jgi:hypothetical protein